MDKKTVYELIYKKYSNLKYKATVRRVYSFYILLTQQGYEETKEHSGLVKYRKKLFNVYIKELVNAGIPIEHIQSLKPSENNIICFNKPHILKFELEKQTPEGYVEPKDLFEDKYIESIIPKLKSKK